MSDNEVWQSVLNTDVTGRHFTMEAPGAHSEGTMKAIEVDEASGYIWFIDSGDNRVVGCTPELGQAFFLSDGSIRVGILNAGALTIDA
jgi:hypothetical protein